MPALSAHAQRHAATKPPRVVVSVSAHPRHVVALPWELRKTAEAEYLIWSMDEQAKARERLRQRLERWSHDRLRALGESLRCYGVVAVADWGRLSWEPCLVVDVPWPPGQQTIWCRPVAVRVEDGRAVYRWRFVWGNHDVDGLRAITYPVSDVFCAAAFFAALIAGEAADGECRPG